MHGRWDGQLVRSTEIALVSDSPYSGKGRAGICQDGEVAGCVGGEVERATGHTKKGDPVSRVAEKQRLRMRRLGVFGHGLGDRAGTQAAGAHGHGRDFARRQLGPHLHEVGLETALGLVVGVADVVADLGLFAAMLADFGHDEVPPENMFAGSVGAG